MLRRHQGPGGLREHADATGCRVVLPQEREAVLRGAAIRAGVAGDLFQTISAAMAATGRAGAVVESSVDLRAYHNAKYAVFQQMHDDPLVYRTVMAEQFATSLPTIRTPRRCLPI
jgi:ribulose kinase